MVYLFRIITTSFKLRCSSYSLVIPTSTLLPDVVPLLVLKKHSKVLTYLHHIIAEQNRKGTHSLITSKIEKLNFWILRKKKSYIMTVSEKNKVTLSKKYGFIENNIFVTNNGIDLGLIEKVKVPTKVSYDICFCGRIYKTKGIYDLLDIMKINKKINKDIKCAVIGHGGERKSFEKNIKDNNLEDNIMLLGYLSEEDKYKVMKSSKMFVLPSHEEGWGIVIGEAMACKLPVVVYALDDIKEIWKDNVIWVNTFDVEEFAQKVKILLKDESERNKLSEKAYSFSQELNWDSVMDKEISNIHYILKKRI